MKIYKKLLSYAPEFKIKAYLAILLSVISSFFLVYGYYYIYKFLKMVVIDSNYKGAENVSFKICGLLIVSVLIYYGSMFISHKLGFRIETNLRKRGVDGLHKASFRFFDTHPSGIVRKTIDDNAEQTHMIIAHLIPDNSRALFIPILLIIMGFFISLKVGVVIVALTVISILLMATMLENKEFMEVYQKSIDDLSSETVEYIRGISVIKVFGVSVDSMKKLFKLIHLYSHYCNLSANESRTKYVIYELVFFGISAIVIIPAAFFFLGKSDPKLLALELTMILFLAGLMYTALMNLMYLTMYTFQANYAVNNIEKLYSEMISEKITFGEETQFNNHNIEFKDVTFSYGDKMVIDNLSFKIDENKVYALVGESGSGKSTIAKLISGYYRIDSGEILIGGKPIESYREDSLMDEISFVFQDTKLFKISIYDNVALAKKNATKEEVLEAMKLAGVLDIADKFEDKENTIIGSKGVYLSGGEKQRIAIARAILKNSNIIIMDEASASIDADNEYELQKAFKNLMKGKTVIMIAHRLSAIKGVDEILVIDDGQIRERGTHEELMNQNGNFSKLYNLYKKANDWRVKDERLS